MISHYTEWKEQKYIKALWEESLITVEYMYLLGKLQKAL
uniref:Uncharacterized protein n=1 Tax=Elizabethkingia anophelis TaxID=1117645 RepID=A0A455ZG61_9FLAO|nr:TPA_exp: hypothetical protein [Elizabethkingia anophelis]